MLNVALWDSDSHYVAIKRYHKQLETHQFIYLLQ